MLAVPTDCTKKIIALFAEKFNMFFAHFAFLSGFLSLTGGAFIMAKINRSDTALRTSDRS